MIHARLCASDMKIMTMRLIDNGEMEINFGAINFISIRKHHRHVSPSNKMLWALILMGNLTACF